MSKTIGDELEVDLGRHSVIVVEPGQKLPTSVDNAIVGFKGFGVGWDVSKNGRTIQMSRSEFEPDHSDQTQTLTWQKAKTKKQNVTPTAYDEYEYWYTGQLERPLDMPIEPYNAVLSGTSDRPFVTDIFGADFSYTRTKFRLGAPVDPAKFDAEHAEDETPYLMARPYIRLHVSGRRALPPTTAPFACIDSDLQTKNLATIAKTYLDARENDGREFIYGANWPYRGSNAVNDADGKAIMECDTLALMALIGMDYDDSPYQYETPSLTADFDTVIAAWTATNAANGIPWFQMSSDQTVQLVEQIDGAWINGLGGRIVDQGAMAWWLWDNGYVFRPEIDGKLDLTQLRSGDLVMFRRAASTYFDNVGHIGVIDVDADGTIYVIHVTWGPWTCGKVVVRSRLEDEFWEIAPGRYQAQDMYFARIPYGSTGKVEGSYIPDAPADDEEDDE